MSSRRWERCRRRAGDDADDPAARVTVNAVRLAARALFHDPRELAGQLVGRLASIDDPRPELDAVRALVARARAWRCGGGAAWWCPVGVVGAGLVSATSATRLVVTGHTSYVNSVAFSADGARIVSGSGDNTVRVWDAATGQPVHVLEGHTGGVWSVAFSADGARIVSGSVDGARIVWDAATGQPVPVLEGRTEPVALAGDGGATLAVRDVYLEPPPRAATGSVSAMPSSGDCTSVGVGFTFDSNGSSSVNLRGGTAVSTHNGYMILVRAAA